MMSKSESKLTSIVLVMSPLSTSTVLILSLIGCSLLVPGTFSAEPCMIDKPSTPCRAMLLNVIEHTLNFIRDFPTLCLGKDSCDARPEVIESPKPEEPKPEEPKPEEPKPEEPKPEEPKPEEPEAETGPPPDDRDIEVGAETPTDTKLEFDLEKGVTQHFTVTYKIEPYPLDLYLLFDISGSMGDDKESIVALSAKLIESLKTLSPDSRLGYGAYSDREDPYTFKNHMSLSADMSTFQDAVRNTEIAGGGDLPEDAGTAMTQVALCDTKIGWRKNARKMIMLLTDATFHLAGAFPAYLNASFVQFDDGCHLDSKGVFTEQTAMDYPSLDQVSKALNDKSISVIMGITAGFWDKTTTEFYDTFAAAVPPSSVGALDSDSGNMIQILEEKYNAIASKLELATIGPVSPDLKIKYLSDCGTGGAVTETSICTGLKSGTSVTFTIQLTLDTCPADPALRKQTVGVDALGLSRPIKADVTFRC